MVPILACLFTFVLFFFRVMQVQLCVQDALEDTGRTLSVYAAVKDSQEEKYAVLAKSMFIAKAREDDNIRKFVTGNVFGITFSESSFEGNDICLRVHYQLKFPVSLLGKKSFWLSQQTIYRKWTGWKDELGIQDGDRWVYIAEQGTVYHKTSGCTYLNLSIQSVEDVQIAEYRNESGEKYHKCELCADKINKFERVYITNYGNKYHTDLNCSGIKRTIEMVRLSDVEGKGRVQNAGRNKDDCFIGQFVFMCMDRLENRAGECAAPSAGRNGSRIIAFVCTGRIRFLFNDGNVCWYRIITLQSGYT